jgi:LuxR family maltose regulon positive regulatory protein
VARRVARAAGDAFSISWLELIEVLLVPQAKVRMPPIPAGLVERTELHAELDTGDVGGVSLVCAPPGYGKSWLLADWANRSSPVRTAWLTIDGDDNDPRRLWASALAALAPHIPLAVSKSIRSSFAWSPAEHTRLVAELVDSLDALPYMIRLILDDVDELAHPEALRGLRTLLRTLPRQLHLVLSSRFEPPLGLNRLRLSGQLRELRVDRLRFTLAESATLLTRSGLRLTAAQLEGLHRRTGGWAAGMRLAALAIADDPDPDRFVAEFSGDERCVADFLTGEILDHLEPEMLAFLRAISIADPISTELAAALSGRDDAGVLLDALEHDMSLLAPVGWRRDTYRLQPLLRTYLRADLRRHGLRKVYELHAAAARWWEADNDVVRALEHARHSDDAALVSELVRRHAVRLIANGDRVPLRRALDDLGGDALVNDPQLALVSAITHLDIGDVNAAQTDLRQARDSWPAQSTPELVVLRSLVEQLLAVSLGQDPALPDALRSDPEQLPPTRELETLMRLSLGAAHLLGSGDLKAARTEFAIALSLAGRAGYDYLEMQARTCLGLAALGVGDLVAVREACLAATVTAAENGWQASVWSILASVVLGFTELQRAEPVEAGHLAGAALEACSVQTSPPLRFALQVLQGAAHYDCGDQLDGLGALQRARSELGDRQATPALLAAAALLEARAALDLGHLAATRTVRGWLTERTGPCAEIELMRAWTAAAEGHEQQARALLRPVLEGTEPALLPHTPVEAWLLEAGLCLTAGERAAARHALLTSLDLARPIDAVRPFAMAGPQVRALLVSQQGSFGASNTIAARAITAAIATHTTTATATALSERELAVLTMLPSLLPLVDIAADLTVSVNTVKSHVRSIYAKLGVSSRREAVLAAHANGLLTIAGN